MPAFVAAVTDCSNVRTLAIQFQAAVELTSEAATQCDFTLGIMDIMGQEECENFRDVLVNQYAPTWERAAPCFDEIRRYHGSVANSVIRYHIKNIDVIRAKISMMVDNIQKKKRQ